MKKTTVLAGTAVTLGALLFSGCSLLFPDTGGGFPEAARASRPSAEELRRKYTGFGFQALANEAEQQLYAAIDEAVYQPQSTEFYSNPFENMQRVSDILELYKDDHPDVFWIDEAEPYYYAGVRDALKLSLHFKLEGEALQTAREELEQAVQTALAYAPQSGSDYEKELYVHDYLIETCTYDDEAVELHKIDQVRANEQNAYGALVEGTAVCEGYTRAFQLLCERLDVTCWVIQGQASDFTDEGNVNHIWNCVQLDGDWYHVDVTWDDYEGAPAATDCYYYFNLTTAEIEKDHVISPLYNDNEQADVWYNGFVPQCDSTAYNYYVLNAMPIDDLDSGDYASFLAQAAANQEASCCFLVSEMLDFEDTFDEIVSGYAYEWVSGANDINGYEPFISNSSRLSANSDRRVVTLLLEYD